MKSNNQKGKALNMAINQIDKRFGKGSIMRLGEQKPLDDNYKDYEHLHWRLEVLHCKCWRRERWKSILKRRSERTGESQGLSVQWCYGQSDLREP